MVLGLLGLEAVAVLFVDRVAYFPENLTAELLQLRRLEVVAVGAADQFVAIGAGPRRLQ
ncbi:hypothetical protein D3C83_262340 [compost metagenome]